jgi:4-amino-4-deoxy-L-arabinose transferase-like glycosyltransferase
MTKMTKKLVMADRRPILAILVLAAGLRLGYALMLGPEPLFPDAIEFQAQALHVAAGEGAIVSEERVATRPPLLAILLAPFAWIWGEDFRPARLFLALISVLTIFLVHRLGSRFGGRDVGIWAALLVALDPFLVYLAPAVLSETVFVFLLVAAVILVHRFREEARWEDGFWGGFFLGLAALTRTSALLLPFWFVLVMRPHKKPSGALALLVGAALAVAPGIVVPSLTLDTWVPITTKGGQNLYEALGPGATGRVRILEMEFPPHLEGLSLVEKDREFRRLAWDSVLERPGVALRLAFYKALYFWNPVPNAEEYRHPWMILVSVLYALPLFVLAILGLRRVWARGGVVLLVPMLYFTALHMVFLGSIRYRVPLHPLMAVMGASFLAHCCRRGQVSGEC